MNEKPAHQMEVLRATPASRAESISISDRFSLRGYDMFRNVTALLFVAACTSGASSTGISELSCPPDSTLNYANFAQDVISTRCLSCHDTKSPHLVTQVEVRAHASQILDAAVYTDAMPGSGSMTLDERRLLGEWLACGAP